MFCRATGIGLYTPSLLCFLHCIRHSCCMKRAASSEVLVAHERHKKHKNLPDLESLLNLLHLTSQPDLEQRFLDIVETLCNRTYLRIYTSTDGRHYAYVEIYRHLFCILTALSDYSLMEVEMYLVKPGHEDPFCHSSEAQRTSGQWYFHRAPTRSPPAAGAPLPGFRGGTRKGLDVTFGGPGAVGGILLRSMRRVSDGTLISGPSLLVDELLSTSSQPSIAALIGK